MNSNSELCKICPIADFCSPYLYPHHANGKRLVTNNPWNCMHLTCPAGIERAKQQIAFLKSQRIFSGYAYFQSPDKPHERRVLMAKGIIESHNNNDFVWYSTGQSIYITYAVDQQYYPFKRIRD